MRSSSLLRRTARASLPLLAPLLLHAPAGAQEDSRRPRLFVVPELGAAMESDRVAAERPSLDAWTLGAQVELVGRSRWTPLVAAHHWRFSGTCDSARLCAETGWSAEAGATRSFVPTSIFRPYAGGVVGVHHIDGAEAFLQGRAGVDLTPARSPVTFRLEGRYHRLLAAPTRVGNFFMLNTGIRFMLPGR